MKKKSDYRVVVESDGNLLRIFSIFERENNDVVIKPKQAKFYREFQQTAKDGAAVIINQKYSIHCSLQSEYGINAIVQTFELSNGETIRTRHYTKALKQNNLFAILYNCRCPNLYSENYITDDKVPIIHLGNYNPKISVMYYMIVVGNPGENFCEANEPDFHHITIQLKKFSLSLFWSFSHMPSDETGAKMHFMTLPPEISSEGYEDLARGFTKSEIIEQYRSSRKMLYEEFKSLIVQKHPRLASYMPQIDLLGFSKQSEYIKPSH